MDYIDWCDFVLATCIEVTSTSPQARSIGVNEFELSQALSTKLGIADFRRQEEYHTSTYYTGLLDAIQSLKAVGLIEFNERSRSHLKVTRLGRKHVVDPLPQWFTTCQEEIDLEHVQLLSIINQLSPRADTNHAWLETVENQTVSAELEDWTGYQIQNVATELEQWGYISGVFFLGNAFKLEATYKGLVWEKRRGFTLISKFIDGLVAEWETTSVDFKRELHLDTADEKAELIKDVLSLANTKASGRHWLIIGFDNRSHAYYGSPDQRLNQDRFEQLLSMYTTPFVDVRYEVVDYREGSVGVLEMLRDTRKLPYSAARSIGDRKRIEQGDIFVRHGSQVERPTSLELQALQDEGDQARLNN
jgi:hypothetical protein